MIKILKNNTISNTRAIKRASRNLRDPNPLSSAMANMSLKFPISIDAEGASRYGVPAHLMSNIEDHHQYGRVLCKREVVDWWVSKSELPDENTIDEIKALFRQHTQDVATYYSVKWNKSRITFGPVELERKAVATSTPVRKVPRDVRDEVLINALIPHLSTPFVRIDPEILKEVNDIKKKRLHSNMKLVSQVRIMRNSFDSRVRYLPSLPGSADLSGVMRHAICGANWRLNVVIPAAPEKVSEMSQLVDIFCNAVHSALLKQIPDRDALVKIIDGTKINGYTVRQAFSICPHLTTESVLITKTLLGLPICMRSEFHKVNFFPHFSDVRVYTMQTKLKIPYKVYSGVERVSFKYDALRGSFSHDGESIYDISCNFTDRTELAHVLAAIAVYCRKNFQDATGRTFNECCENMFNVYRLEPWKVIGCRRSEWFKINHQPTRRGELTICIESEIYQDGEEKCKLLQDLTISSLRRKQMIRPNNKPRDVTFSPLITVPTHLLDDYLPPTQRLRRKILFYYNNPHQLESKIKANDYGWENQSIDKLMPTEHKLKISSTARAVISRLFYEGKRDKSRNVKLAFLYCFAHSIPVEVGLSDLVTEFRITGDILIDFYMKKGILIFDDRRNNYTISGIPIGRTQVLEHEIERFTFGLVPGYTLNSDLDLSAPLVLLKTLIEERNTLTHGESRRIFINGREYTATRDEHIANQALRTIRHRVAQSYQTMDSIPSLHDIVTVKRPLLIDYSDTISAPKKIKLTEDDIEYVAPRWAPICNVLLYNLHIYNFLHIYLFIYFTILFIK